MQGRWSTEALHLYRYVSTTPTKSTSLFTAYIKGKGNKEWGRKGWERETKRERDWEITVGWNSHYPVQRKRVWLGKYTRGGWYGRSRSEGGDGSTLKSSLNHQKKTGKIKAFLNIQTNVRFSKPDIGYYIFTFFASFFLILSCIMTVKQHSAADIIYKWIIFTFHALPNLLQAEP